MHLRVCGLYAGLDGVGVLSSLSSVSGTSMTIASHSSRSLFAVSDLHVAYQENREIVETIRPESEEDWLLIAGDIAEIAEDIEWALGLLSRRFAKVVWAPGNHELWTMPNDALQLRGEARYRHLVEVCRRLGVITPEDPYEVWTGTDGPVTIAPLLVLYDYTFRPDGVASKEEGLALAHRANVVCTDEYLLHADPYPSIDEWCRARVGYTRDRLAALGDARTILVNHYPLVREPTRILRFPEFAQWCGTELTANWHHKFNVYAVVYGHLHIPRTTWHDGVRFEEVSIGYPREWRQQIRRHGWLRQILPTPGDEHR
jgi:3',5'-cyclic AMP phosphodiesterase CpdA